MTGLAAAEERVVNAAEKAGRDPVESHIGKEVGTGREETVADAAAPVEPGDVEVVVAVAAAAAAAAAKLEEAVAAAVAAAVEGRMVAQRMREQSAKPWW